MENREIESYDEEIDLFEYLDLFWQKKWNDILRKSLDILTFIGMNIE